MVGTLCAVNWRWKAAARKYRAISRVRSRNGGHPADSRTTNVRNWSAASSSLLAGNCPSRLALSSFRLVGFSDRCPRSAMSVVQQPRQGGERDSSHFFEDRRIKREHGAQKCESGNRLDGEGERQQLELRLKTAEHRKGDVQQQQECEHR